MIKSHLSAKNSKDGIQYRLANRINNYDFSLVSNSL